MLRVHYDGQTNLPRGLPVHSLGENIIKKINYSHKQEATEVILRHSYLGLKMELQVQASTFLFIQRNRPLAFNVHCTKDRRELLNGSSETMTWAILRTVWRSVSQRGFREIPRCQRQSPGLREKRGNKYITILKLHKKLKLRPEI
jgi:hypothetical protein